MHLQPLILAAGKGTRMRSKRPKVLQELSGKPLVSHVIAACEQVEAKSRPIVVVGYGSEQVKQQLGDDVIYAEQAEQLGTGHAVMVANGEIDDQAIVVVLYGDVPLISAQTIKSVYNNAKDGGLSILSAFMADPAGYGRILRTDAGTVVGIVEHKDADADQLEIKEVNTGVLALRGDLLKPMVAELSNDNAQGEYYLTDIVSMAQAQGIVINASQPMELYEVLGVNDRKQLAELESHLRKQKIDKLLTEGATLTMPETVDVRGELISGQDVTIGSNVVFEGAVTLGDDVVIEPNCIIIDSNISDGAHIRAFSHLENASVGPMASIGPYARLRPGSTIGESARVGNFVETKNMSLGAGSKANHLTYLGDSEIGAGVNIGAGTITCNYDGKNKHQTKISDDVFVGSNSALIAPVRIRKGATVAAGTVVSKDVGDNELCIARSPQKAIKNWVRPDQKNPGQEEK